MSSERRHDVVVKQEELDQVVADVLGDRVVTWSNPLPPISDAYVSASEDHSISATFDNSEVVALIGQLSVVTNIAAGILDETIFALETYNIIEGPNNPQRAASSHEREKDIVVHQSHLEYAIAGALSKLVVVASHPYIHREVLEVDLLTNVYLYPTFDHVALEEILNTIGETVNQIATVLNHVLISLKVHNIILNP